MKDALDVYAVCVVVLFFKMFAVSCYQGYFRLRHVAFTNPEDAAVFRRQPEPDECRQVIRAAKAWANDLENIPLFFALGGVAIAVGAPATAIAWLSVSFTVARCLHTLSYLACVQPWRTVCYGIGIVCLAGLAAMIAAGVLMLRLGA